MQTVHRDKAPSCVVKLTVEIMCRRVGRCVQMGASFVGVNLSFEDIELRMEFTKRMCLF